MGGVLLNIDYNLTTEAFKELGIAHFDEIFSKFRQDRVADNFEKGFISENDFRNYIRDRAGRNYDDYNIDRAWNAMLLDFPPRRLNMLQKLSSDGYQLFLLSNTNSIHMRSLLHDFNVQFGIPFDSLFNRVYLSFEMGMRKPEKEIFGKVLNDFELHPAETLYVEDSQQHVETAKQLGIESLLIPTNGETDLLVFNRIAPQNPFSPSPS